MIPLFRTLFFSGLLLRFMPVFFVVVGFLSNAGANANAYGSLISFLAIIMLPVMAVVAVITLACGVAWYVLEQRRRLPK